MKILKEKIIYFHDFLKIYYWYENKKLNICLVTRRKKMNQINIWKIREKKNNWIF